MLTFIAIFIPPGARISIRAVREAVHARQTQVMLGVLSELSPELIGRVLPNIHTRYSRNELTLAFVRDNMSEYSPLLHRIDRIGALLYNQYIPHELFIEMFPRWPIRLWIELEAYVRDMRRTRPHFFQYFEYVAYASLAKHLKARPLETLLVGEPAYNADIQKRFEPPALRSLLALMRDELQGLGLRSKIISELAELLKEDIYYY